MNDFSEESLIQESLGEPRPWLRVGLVRRNARIIALSKCHPPKSIPRIIEQEFQVAISVRRVHSIIQKFHAESLRRFRRNPMAPK